MDAGLTAVSKRRKTKDGKMNSLKCRYVRHMFHCMCVGGCTDFMHTAGENLSAMAAYKVCFISL